MLIDSKELVKALYTQKQQVLLLLDKAKHNKVRYALEARLTDLDIIFKWLDASEKQGEIDMESLKLGELVKWEPRMAKEGMDAKIIEDSKALKKNFDAIKVTVENVNWNTLQNRVYELRRENRLPANIVPRRDENKVPYLVYFDEPIVRKGRSKK